MELERESAGVKKQADESRARLADWTAEYLQYVRDAENLELPEARRAASARMRDSFALLLSCQHADIQRQERLIGIDNKILAFCERKQYLRNELARLEEENRGTSPRRLLYCAGWGYMSSNFFHFHIGDYGCECVGNCGGHALKL